MVSTMQKTLDLRSSSIRGNGPRHDPRKATGDILILLRGLNACKNLLDTNANFRAAGNFLDLTDGALLVTVRECTRLLKNVCELILSVNVRYRYFGIKATEQVELREHRALSRCCENE